MVIILAACACLAAVADDNTLPPVRSAAEVDYPPFSMVNAAGNADGFSVELLRATLRAMEREVTFETGTWAEVRGLLERGEIDALPLVGRTPEREELFDFTFPYMTLHGALVVRNDTAGITDLEDLRGREVAVMAGDNAEEFLLREERGINVVSTHTFEQAFQELSAGRHDAVLVQRLVALRLMQEGAYANLRIVNKPVEDFSQEFCLAVKEGDGKTLALLNEGLALVMADGTYRHLHAKWFAALELPVGQRIVIGGDHNYPPFEYLDEHGRPAGYTVELTRAIANALDMDIEIRLGPWTEIQRGLDSGEIDALQGMFYTPARDLKYAFSDAHSVNSYVSAVRKGEGLPPTTPDALRGKRIVAQEGDVILEWLADYHLDSTVTLVESQEDMLRELAGGDHDCALVARASAMALVTKHGWDNLVLGKTPVFTGDYCYAVPNARKALLAQLSEGLQIIEASGEYRRIHDKWLGVYRTEQLTLLQALQYSAMVLGPLLAVLLAVFAWSWTLCKQVALRTRELRASEEFQRSLIACSPVALYSIGLDGYVQSWNASAERVFGWTAEEVLGRPLPIVPDRYQDEYVRLRKQLVESGGFSGLEVTRCKKDGTLFTGSLSAAPIRGADGAITGIMGAVEDITERIRAQEEIKASEERFRSFVENAPDAIFVVTHSRFAYANQACIRLLRGGDVAQILGQPVFDRFFPDNKAKVAEYLRILNEERKPLDTVVGHMLTMDGTGIPVEVAAVPFRMDDTDGALVFVRDIRERIQAQEDIEQSERRFRRAVEESPFPIMIHAEDGEVMAVSRGWRDITGYDETELATIELWTERAYADNRDAVRATIRSSYSLAGSEHEGEFNICCKDGSHRVWDFSSTPLGLLPDGRRVTISMAADVTERRQSEERIVHLNRVLRAIRDINQLIVHERDRDTLIREVCRMLVEQRSYKSSLIILADAGDRPVAWAEDGIGGRSAALDDMLGRGELPPCCAVARQAGGPCMMSEQGVSCSDCEASGGLGDKGILCTPLLGADGSSHGYLVVTLDGAAGHDEEERGLFAEMASDLSFALGAIGDRAARLRAEEDREDIQRQLLQSQKMEAVGQLAGGIAHDFNNILQALMGYTQMLLDEAAERGEPHEELKEIFKGTERAAALTRQLLAFSRRQVMQPEVLDLNAVIENILKMLRRVIGEHIRLEWIPGIRLGSVHADAGMLEQVLMNLCVNARDAMEAGGTLTIETMNVLIDSEYCESHAWATPGRYVLLSMTDTGCGMDAETLGHMFEPFYTTKSEGKGTGLGLATVYGIVQQHEGNILAYSEPGKGTTFKIYLPVCERTAAAMGNLVEGLADGGTETILLAEDDPNVMKLAKRILERAGYTVICAADGAEAVMLFKEHGGKIDLLLLDVVMPGLGGQEVLDRIRTLQPDIPALFSSGYSENGIHTGFVLKTGLRLIQKPYRPSVLLKAIREILDGEK